MRSRLLIILSPPRSFSSVVSTMIGQHPQLYCFPELHLFVADTVGEVLEREQAKRNYGGPPGVLRTLAQLHEAEQTTRSIIRASLWLAERRHWTVKALIDYLLDAVAPWIGVEKSPVTCSKPAFLARAYACYPDAYYLHLTRHPVSTRHSMQEFFAEQRAFRARSGQQPGLQYDDLLTWYRMHRLIYELTARLPLGQSLQIKGEDLLSAPESYLVQIAEWLGVSTDAAAIEAMMHPEDSPYASVGPAPARGGNDGKFMRSPRLRSGTMKEPSLQTFWNQGSIDWLSAHDRASLSDAGLQLAASDSIAAEIQGLSERMGYR